jgi:hypothetical protein
MTCEICCQRDWHQKLVYLVFHVSPQVEVTWSRYGDLGGWGIGPACPIQVFCMWDTVFAYMYWSFVPGFLEIDFVWYYASQIRVINIYLVYIKLFVKLQFRCFYWCGVPCYVVGNGPRFLFRQCQDYCSMGGWGSCGVGFLRWCWDVNYWVIYYYVIYVLWLDRIWGYVRAYPCMCRSFIFFAHWDCVCESVPI